MPFKSLSLAIHSQSEYCVSKGNPVQSNLKNMAADHKKVSAAEVVLVL